MFPTQVIAEDALIEARTAYEYNKGQGPVGVYLCEECGHYHLTSQGVMNEKLAKLIADGQISRQKEANRWLKKLKKR